MAAPALFQVVVAVLIERAGTILLTQRAPTKDHAPGAWEASLTGRVERGESCEEAALREVREEVGLDVELVAPFHTFHYYRGAARVECQGVAFWARYRSGEVTLATAEQVAYRWVPPEAALAAVDRPGVVETMSRFLAFRARYAP
jgi:8-oxo-dGTP pyrophosphatase MutT (NUDIX family)